MIPLVGEAKEFNFVRNIVVAVADEEIKNAGSDLKYEVGTMIEIPLRRIYDLLHKSSRDTQQLRDQGKLLSSSRGPGKVSDRLVCGSPVSGSI